MRAVTRGMLTAERKVPGGKLLRADIAAEGSEIREVALHGDFFIYPEEALDAIEAALAGRSADENVLSLVQAIEDAVPDDTRYVGFAPPDVATLVQEAVRDG